MKSPLAVCMVAMSLVCAATPASATTIAFTGTITGLSGFVGETFLEVGQTFDGSFIIFDESTSTDVGIAVTFDSAFQVRYADHLNIGDSVVFIRNNVNGADSLTVASNLANTNGGSSTVTLQDNQGTAFNSSSLSQITALAMSGDLSAFEIKTIDSTFNGQGEWGNCDPRCDVFGSLDSLSVVAAVPEPGTALLLITGFGLVGRALRARRQAMKS